MIIERYTDLIRFLRQNGYSERPDVKESGDFSVHGDTVQLWPAAVDGIWRLHFLGEALERAEMRANDSWQVMSHTQLEVFQNTLDTPHGTIYPGDYIVHPHHGVGIFQSLVRQDSFEGASELYCALTYAGNDRLLVPLDRQNELMPYIGTRHPRLTRLYSKAWQATKERVQRDLIAVARGLLKIYAARQLHHRPIFAPAPEWQEYLEKGSGFELTEDQGRALKDIAADFASNQPMDRLVCGDVGFGKTEVALRAAAQVLASGYQVAFLAPTTVLAEQHYELIKVRFAGLPVRVAHMSRLTKGSDATTLGGMADGSVDIVVGTHGLLGKNVVWKALGLLIVDEEQKFGVAQKERLKSLRPSLDTLSLSATPIPRTLSMSLSGLRGLSILRQPPKGRLPIATKVEPYTDAELKAVIEAELARGGQVYVVHHRVQPLRAFAERIRSVLADSYPEARIALAHGQLPEQELARTVGDFMAHQVDILVASTIVEHGLDSPHANTLVVLRSEYFGLSDLYQLRGRVGRRQKQAYATFFTGSLDGVVTEEDADRITQTAQQRLKALMEADALGSGWSIALRDLEIRGGGNILGYEQHGSMEAIGLLLYAQLLQEEIGRQAQKQGILLFQKTAE